MLGAFLARSALMKMVPKWVWIALAGAALVLLGLWWHSGKVKAFGDERYRAGWESRGQVIDVLQKRLAAKDAELARALRSKHNEQIRRIAVAADAVRVRGPGQALCSPAAVPAVSGGAQAGGAGNGAVANVHNQQREPLVGLPFAAAVDFAEQHDTLRAEVLTLRAAWDAYTAQWKAYEKQAQTVATSP